MISQTVAFIGAGQMAQALARGFLSAELLGADQIRAHDPFPAARQQFLDAVDGAAFFDSNQEAARGAEVILLAVKPQVIDAVASDLANVLTPQQLVVSIAAGVTLRRLTTLLGSDRVIRVMPNTPCLVGKGAAGYSLGNGVASEDGSLVEKLLGAVGIAFAVDEKLLDAVTGLSGSGPAYVMLMIEAMSDGGVRMGLPRNISAALAAQTVAGAAQWLLQTGEHPAQLKDRVASPGGTTIAGIQALEDHRFRAAVISAVQAATIRSQELGDSLPSETRSDLP